MVGHTLDVKLGGGGLIRRWSRPEEGAGGEHQVAIKWWLGMDTSQGSQCALRPDKALDPLGHHAITCKHGGDVVAQHNTLRDVLAETCHRAHQTEDAEIRE